MDPVEAKSFRPRVVLVDDGNRIKSVERYRDGKLEQDQ